MPPPSINLNSPAIIATMHMVLPFREFTMLLKIRPNTAMGILTQLSHPNRGRNATSIMIKDIIPQSVPNILICFIKLLVTVLKIYYLQLSRCKPICFLSLLSCLACRLPVWEFSRVQKCSSQAITQSRMRYHILLKIA